MIALINNEYVKFDKTSCGKLDSDKDKEKYKHLEYLGYGTIDSINGRKQDSVLQWHFWKLV